MSIKLKLLPILLLQIIIDIIYYIYMDFRVNIDMYIYIAVELAIVIAIRFLIWGKDEKRKFNKLSRITLIIFMLCCLFYIFANAYTGFNPYFINVLPINLPFIIAVLINIDVFVYILYVLFKRK